MQDYQAEGRLPAKESEGLPCLFEQVRASGPDDHLQDILRVGLRLKKAVDFLHQLSVLRDMAVVDYGDLLFPGTPDYWLRISLTCFSGGRIADMAYSDRPIVRPVGQRMLKDGPQFPYL